MIVRRLASRRLVRNGSTEEEPRRKRAARFLLIIFTAGVFAGVAAWLDVWPFGNIHTLIAEVFGSGGPSQIDAQTVYPSVAPVQKTVDVYATPPPARRTQPTAPASSRPHASPSPTHEPDD